MKKKSSKYLDALFRKVLSEGKEHTSSMEQDWTVMERRLDQQERRRRIFLWIRSAGGIAIIILLVAIFWPSPDSKQLLNQNITEKPIENRNDPARNNREEDLLKPNDTNKANIQDKPQEKSATTSGVVEPPVATNEHSIHPDQLQTTRDLRGITQKQPLNAEEKNFETQDIQSTPDLAENLNTKDQVWKPSKNGISKDPAADPLAKAIPNDPSAEGISINPSEKRPTETISENSLQKPIIDDVSQLERKDKQLIGERQSEKAATTTPEKENTAATGKQLALNKKGGLYYGLVTGPDLSMIKSQSVKDIGYSIGLLAGYRFNEHWSVETGLSWAKKKYYTEGKYFDKSDANIPASINLISLDGGCEMLIVPVSARYDFAIGKQSFFTTAGLNSYFMKKESYDYLAGSVGWTYDGFKSYKNSGNHLFSNLQFTAGYNYSLSPRTRLRIEPYINIPLKKVGIGKMPLTSAGLYLGIVLELISRPASRDSK